MSKKLISLILFVISLALLGQDDGFNGILYHDIETSTLEELQVWNSELGLKNEGDEATLKRQLRQYYKLESGLSGAARGEGTVIEIRSAGLLDTISIEGADDQNLLLSGGIQLYLKENNGVEHLVEAEQVYIDQLSKVMSAKGDVVYTKTSGSDVETFKGEGLSFSIENWEGIFFDGQTLRAQKIKDPKAKTEELIDFVYGGALFIKGAGNSFLLKDAIITSSDFDNPNYHITASEIIILAPGEWTLSNAVLYIGRIPFFYFPFFFYPGRELIFNPVAGYRSREGTYVMTTTYFLGEKSEEDEMFSFIQLGDLTGGNVQKERIGIYLDKTFSEEAEEKEKGLLKLGIDYYTKLGGAAYLEGDLSHVDWASKLKFSFGLGVSRILFEDTNLFAATPYLIKPDGSISQYWEETNFLGLELPFRYYGSIEYSNSFNGLDVSTGIAIYSDAQYDNDFKNREESMDFTFSGDSDEDDTSASTVTPSVSLSLNYSSSLKPFETDILTLSGFSLNSSVSFSKKLHENASLAETHEDYSPLYKYGVLSEFFYPTSANILSTKMTIGGKFGNFQYPFSLADQDSGNLPFAITDDQQDVQKKADQDLLSGTSIPSSPQMYNGSFSFSYIPSYGITSSFDAEKWKKPSSINLEDYSLRYSNLNLSGHMLYKASMLNNFISLTYKVNSSFTYPWLLGFGDSYNETSVENKIKEVFEGKKFQNSQEFSVSAYPLNFISELSKTNITYSLNSRLFDFLYNSTNGKYEGSIYDYKEDVTTKSAISGNLNYNKGDFSQSLSLSSTVYPKEPRVDLTSVTSLPFLSLSFINNFAEDDNLNMVLKSSKGTANFNIEPIEDLKLSSTAAFDFSQLDSFEVTSWNTSINFDPISISYKAATATSYEFNAISRRWDEKEKNVFIPLSLDFDVNTINLELYSWYNRLNLKLSGDLNYSADFQQYNKSTMDISYSLAFNIKEFLSLEIKGVSENTAAYRYIPYFADQMGADKYVNPITDIINSLNFADTTKREESIFNLKNISVSLNHFLDDWKLTFTYTGIPKADTISKEYIWDQTLDIVFQWNAIPELKSQIDYDDEKWSIKED